VLATQNASLAQADLQEAKDSQAAAAAALYADEHPQQSSVAREQDAVASAKHRLAAAKAAVEQDEMALTATSIVAPASGTVAAVSAEAGDSITDATLHDPVVTIDSGPLMVFARLPGTEIGEVRPGQAVTFDIPQLGASLPGKVVQVDQSASQSQTAVSYVVLCSIEPNHTALMAGMTVNITP
jgi:multidrug resistance efflux pump